MGQLALALQVDERTARRMLTRLVHEQYVTRLTQPRGRFVLTLRLAALVAHALKHSTLVRLGTSVLARLHTQTGTVAHLVSPAYDCVLCLVSCDQAGLPGPRLGELAPAHCTAAGKALLAARDGWRQSLLNSPLHRYTDRTVTDPSAFEQEAAITRERGYAIENGEYHRGARAIAATVHDDSGAAIAAIGVSTGGALDVDSVSDYVTQAADTLSAALAMHATRSTDARRGSEHEATD